MKKNKKNNEVNVEIDEKEQEKMMNVSRFMLGVIIGFLVGLIMVTISDNLGVVKSKNITKLKILADTVMTYYNGDLSETDMNENIYKGVLNNLDDFSQYYTKKEYQKYLDTTKENYGGIGIAFNTFAKRMIITEVFENSPAEKQGLKVNDEICEVDGTLVSTLLKDPDFSLRGKIGTKVTLTIRREKKDLFDVVVTREDIQRDMVRSEKIDDKTMYIQIHQFTGDVAKEVKTVLDKNKGIENIIFDLRDNGGGEVSVLKDTLEVFLPKDDIFCKFVSKNSSTQTEKIENNITKLDYKIVVLVNANTASCSEIFSGYIQEKGYGKILGLQTFGKGSSQIMKELDDGSAIKITNTLWYLPSGKGINDVGIIPDIEVDRDYDVEDLTNIKTDNQVEKAIETLKSGM